MTDEPFDLKAGDTLAVPPEKTPCHRPVSYRNAQPRTISFRPSRFIKGATPSLSAGSSAPVSDDMQSFIHVFDLYTQKVYIEGYLFKHTTDSGLRTRCFAELCGSTLSVWDAEVQAPSVMPQYINISDASVYCCEDDNKTTKCFVVVSGTKTTLKFEATDEATMSRWICAIRLACFEKKRLHLLFTFKLLLESYDPAADIPTAKWDAHLQVYIGSEWQKCRVTVNDRASAAGNTGGGSRLFGGSGKKTSNIQENHQLAIYDTKKSKIPNLTVTDITHAYAVYPESPQLITKSCILRVEGSVLRKGDKQPKHGYVLIMADNCQQMSAGLFAIYDKFKLYGRPEALTTDPSVETALNFGVDPCRPGLFLDLEDALQCNDAKDATDELQIEHALLGALHKRLSEPIRPGAGARANSLPLITVACEDTQSSSNSNNEPLVRQRSMSGDEEKPRPHSPYKLSYQVADSSDESDEDGEDEEDEEDDEEVDSDDEPIGKSRSAARPKQQQSSQQRSLVESLIPDFDFGNGFDVSHPTQNSSTSSLFEPTANDDGYTTRSRQTSISIVCKESVHSSSGNDTLNVNTGATAKEQSSSSSSSSLFGDFSLSLDFPKFDERKYSLSASVKLSEQDSMDRRPSSSACGTSSSGSSILDYSKRWDNHRRARSTDLSYWGEDDYANDEYISGTTAAAARRHSYDAESDDLDDDAPIIPSLHDHFAPQNSLLDSYLGDQLTAKEQIEYCRATGQPLIQVSSNKPEIPDSGFVGMISRREKERKEGNYQRVSERVQRHHADRSLLEREKERRLFEQRQQQWMKHQVGCFLYAASVHVADSVVLLLIDDALSQWIHAESTTHADDVPAALHGSTRTTHTYQSAVA